MTEKNLDILNGVQSQISSFDNKAGILVSIISIIFALSINFLELLRVNNQIVLTIIFLIYVMIFLMTISFLLMVVIPRTHKSKESYINYYRDLTTMDFAKYKINKDNFFSNEEVQFNQIKINAKICKIKHFYLKGGIILSFIFTFTLGLLMLLKLLI